MKEHERNVPELISLILETLTLHSLRFRDTDDLSWIPQALSLLKKVNQDFLNQHPGFCIAHYGRCNRDLTSCRFGFGPVDLDE